MPPEGFVALGVVLNNDLTKKPSPEVVRCVHRSIVLQGFIDPAQSPGEPGHPCTVWLISAPRPQDRRTFNLRIPAGTFIAHASAQAPNSTHAYCLQFSRLRVYSDASLFLRMADSSSFILVSRTQRYADSDILQVVRPARRGGAALPPKLEPRVYVQDGATLELPLPNFCTLTLLPTTTMQAVRDKIFSKRLTSGLCYPRNRYRLALVNLVSGLFYWLPNSVRPDQLLTENEVDYALVFSSPASPAALDHKTQLVFCPFDNVPALAEGSLLSQRELTLLYELFDEAVGEATVLDLPMFSKWLFSRPLLKPAAGVQSGERFEGLVEALFSAMDLDSSGAVNFSEFSKALSTVCRGELEDQVEFSFRLFSSVPGGGGDGGGKVSSRRLGELARVCHSLLRLVDPNTPSFFFAPYVDSDEAFTELEFLEKARSDSSIASCFGLSELLPPGAGTHREARPRLPIADHGARGFLVPVPDWGVCDGFQQCSIRGGAQWVHRVARGNPCRCRFSSPGGLLAGLGHGDGAAPAARVHAPNPQPPGRPLPHRWHPPTRPLDVRHPCQLAFPQHPSLRLLCPHPPQHLCPVAPQWGRILPRLVSLHQAFAPSPTHRRLDVVPRNLSQTSSRLIPLLHPNHFNQWFPPTCPQQKVPS